MVKLVDKAGDVVDKNQDKYGGWKGLKFHGTGFFRLEKSDRWWFVTPEGNGYLSFGLNHIEPVALMARYNVDYWANQFGLAPEDKTNINAFLPGFEKKVEADFCALGFNALGCHTENRYFSRNLAPYTKIIRFVNTCHYMEPGPEEYFDVFSDKFKEHCDRLALETIPPIKDDPYLLGYFFTDCPIYTELDAAPRIRNIYGNTRKALTTFHNKLRNLPGNAPGKKAYVKTMKAIYASIRNFNDVYYTDFNSFDELEKKANWRTGVDLVNDKETGDNLAFLYAILDKMFEVEVAAVRKYDKNHLIFGDKLNANTFTPPEIVKLCNKHFDLVDYQIYGLLFDHEEIINQWSKLISKPLLIGDGGVNATNRQVPDPYGPHCGSQLERAENFREIVRFLFSRKNFVGLHWCGWMDQWKYMQPGKQHMGIQDAFGKYYDIATEMIEFSTTMYDIAQSGL
jgi:hypothetical protein